MLERRDSEGQRTDLLKQHCLLFSPPWPHWGSVNWFLPLSILLESCTCPCSITYHSPVNFLFFWLALPRPWVQESQDGTMAFFWLLSSGRGIESDINTFLWKWINEICFGSIFLNSKTWRKKKKEYSATIFKIYFK